MVRRAVEKREGGKGDRERVCACACTHARVSAAGNSKLRENLGSEERPAGSEEADSVAARERMPAGVPGAGLASGCADLRRRVQSEAELKSRDIC